MENTLESRLLLSQSNTLTKILGKKAFLSSNTEDKSVQELEKVLNFIRIQGKINLSYSFQKTFQGHSNWVNCLSYSPSGDYIASGSSDSTIKLWDVETSQEITLREPKGAIMSLAFTPDGQFLATGSTDTTVKLWNLKEKSIDFTMSGHIKTVLAICISHNGKILASGGSDFIVIVWDLNEKQAFWTLPSFKTNINSIIFASDNQTLIVASSNEKIRLWNVKKKNELGSMLGHEDTVFCVKLSSDGKFFASGSRDKSIKMWNLAEAKEEFTLIGHKDSVYSLAFSFDMKFFASGSWDKVIIVWDFQTRDKIYTLTGHGSSIYGLSFSPRSYDLASGSSDFLVKVWKLRPENKVRELDSHEKTVMSLAFSPDGSLLASGSADCTIQIWSTADGNKLFSLLNHSGSINGLSFHPTENLLASGSSDKLVKLWDLSTKEENVTFSNHTHIVNCVIFSPDGKYLVSGAFDRKIKFYNLLEKKEEFMFTGHVGPVFSLSFSPDGRYLASGSEAIKIWSLEKKMEEFSLTAHGYSISCVSFSSDGRFLASSSKGKEIKIWNLNERKEDRSLNSHTNYVTCISFYQDNRFLASASQDKTVRIWDLASNNEFVMQEFKGSANSLSFSSDGRYFACAGEDKKVFLYELEKWGNKDEVCFSRDGKFLIQRVDDGEKYVDIKTGNEDKTSLVLRGNTDELTFVPTSCYENFLQNWEQFYQAFRCIEGALYEKITYPNMQFSNLRFSVAHFLSYLGLKDLISTLLQTSHLVLLPDSFGHLPIFYSIKSQQQETTEILLQHLASLSETEPSSLIKYISWGLLENDLLEIIRNSSSSLDHFLGQSLFTHNTNVYFGEPLSPLPSFQWSPYVDLCPEAFSGVGIDKLPLIFKSTAFCLPSTPGTQGSLEILKAILASRNKDVYRTELIQYFIRSKWSKVQAWVYLYTFLLWVNILMLVLLQAQPSLPLIISLLTVNSLLLLWEFIQVLLTKIEYFQSPMNILDTIRIFCTFTYAILLIFSFKDYRLTWSTIAFSLIRGLTGFRAFDNTRYYIRLISESFFCMKDFLIIFIYTTFSLSLLNIVSSNETLLNFDNLWFSGFGLVVGLTDSFNKENYLQSASFIIAITVNLIIMLNMIISLLGDAFDEFQLMAEVHNYREMLEVVFEIEQLMSIVHKDEDLKHFHVCTHAYEASGSQWKGKVLDIREFVQKKVVNEGVKPMMEKSIKAVEEGMKNIDNRIKRMTRNLGKENEKELEGSFGNRMERLEGEVKEIRGKVDGIEASLMEIKTILMK